MKPRIEFITEKKLVGRSIEMTLANNRTPELFRSFMPRRGEIDGKTNTDVLCVQVFKGLDNFNEFSPQTVHQKWAAVEVNEFGDIPEGMETLVIPAGQYAVFSYKGSPAEAMATFQYIFNVWMPASEYEVDSRPHFDVLGEKYKNNDPDSEEELWIPVRAKNAPHRAP